MAGGIDLALKLRRHGFANPLGGRGRDIGRVVDGEGHVVLVVHAVGDVVVHEKVGQPAVKHLEEGAGFRRVGLHVVAVQVEVAAVGAPAG